MTVLEAAAWGGVGGAMYALVNLYEFMLLHIRRRYKWNFKWNQAIDFPTIAVVFGIRVAVGSAISAMLISAEQITGPLAAFGAGIAAPALLAQVGRFSMRSLEASDEAEVALARPSEKNLSDPVGGFLNIDISDRGDSVTYRYSDPDTSSRDRHRRDGGL
ncbi:hypothetical protein [Nocardia sp. NPDC057272]|uniref:hypothetical protein n=1 Tax=Nocardia sp. NPDC057272 TaxID=3346079 RepID=UPI0036422F92